MVNIPSFNLREFLYHLLSIIKLNILYRKRLKQVEYFKHKNESIKTMNNYTQFFNKYTERTANNVKYQANLVNAVTSYLKNNGYQVTDNIVATGCQKLIDIFEKENIANGYASSYKTNPTNKTRIDNALASVFPPKQNIAQNVEQQTQTQSNPQGTGNTNPQNTGNSNQDQPQQPQDPKDNGSKTPEDNPPKSDLPQDDPMNDLSGISMLTKDELRAMVNKGPLSKIMANLVSGKNIIDKVKSYKFDNKANKNHPGIKISNIQITGTDNVYDNENNTNNKSRKSYNKQQNKSNKVGKSQNEQIKA